MKNLNVIILFFLFILNINAQQKNGIIGGSNWFDSWTNFKAKTTEYRECNTTLSGNIEKNTTLYRKNVYHLIGSVHVLKNVTLTIEPGTVIRGDFETCGSLIITKGAKLIAEGSEGDPIIFTSNNTASNRKAGDWGGIIMLGYAPINSHGGMAFFPFDKNIKYNGYGGKNEDDNSGIIKYVRIEFGGKKDEDGYSSNGISLAGVGNKTILENINIVNSFDDSIEVYGGNILLKNIVSYLAQDDDFDFTQGAQAIVNNSIALRYPYVSDVLRSRCFEIENYDKIENHDASKMKTSVRLNNVSMVNIENNDLDLVKEAISINPEAYLEIENSLVIGFSSLIAFDNYFLEKENYKKIKVKNTSIHNCNIIFSDKTFKFDFEMAQKLNAIQDWFMESSNNIVESKIDIRELFVNPDVKKYPDFRVK